MDAVQLYHILHRKPFVPFRVVRKDGQTFDVLWEHLAVVCTTYVVIGTPSSQGYRGRPYAEDVDYVELSDIDRVEDLPAVLAPSKA
jgi:hypothetical protein